MPENKVCRRGHPQTPSVISRPYVHTRNGRTYFQCRLCQTLVERLRYRNNPDYRKKRQEAALARYHRRKQEHFADV